MRALVLIVLLGAVPVVAQDLPDAGLPDASVGQGGAERDNEEGDAEGSACVDTSTCGARLECVNSRCVPSKSRTVGCSSLGDSFAFAALALGLLRRRR
ncbi:MAG: hypothetical protein QM817_22940 [Archangium sp.]